MLSVLQLLAELPVPGPEEFVQTILARGDVRIERIVSQGHVSPEGFWYDQAEAEFVVVLQGAARLQFEDETVELTAGSSIDIPVHRRHRVAWTDPSRPTVWLAVFYAAAE